MRVTRLASAAVGVAALSGCVFAYREVAIGRYSMEGRPDPSYYCYDCHGYRFFDPYYDWCTYYGFAYAWQRHPRAIVTYRSRYVRIRESHRDFGRYTYPEDYRAQPRYRDPRDYESWRQERRQRPEEPDRSLSRPKSREENREGPGRKKHKRHDGARAPAEGGSGGSESLASPPEGAS